MINWGMFMRPAPPLAGPPPPLDETGIIDSAFENMNRRSQQGKENARADEQMALNERHANLQDRRQQEYQQLQNREQGFREKQGNRAHEDNRRQQLYALLEKFQHAQTPQEAATYAQMLGQLGYPVRSLQKMEAPNAPTAPHPTTQPSSGAAPGIPGQPAQLSPEAAAAVGGMMQGGNKSTAAPMTAQETRQLSGMGARPMLPESKPASAGIIPQRALPEMASQAPDAGGPAPRGGGGVAPIQGPPDELSPEAQAAVGEMMGGGNRSMLPGQSPVLQVPPEWLRQYMEAEKNPERGFLSEGDALR